MFIGASEKAFVGLGYLLLFSKLLKVAKICLKGLLRFAKEFLVSRQEVLKKNGPHINMLLLTGYK